MGPGKRKMTPAIDLSKHDFEAARQLAETEDSKVAALDFRFRMVIHRGYLYGWLTKPLETLTDAELLRVPQFGRCTLYQFRKIVPMPKQEVE